MAYEPNEFGYKDGLPSGDPDKVIKGSDFDVEFNAIKEALDSVDVEVNVDDVNGLGQLLDDKADKSDLEQEIQDRKDGDAALQGNIDGVSASLSQEIRDRQNGDIALGDRIDNLVSDDLADVNSAGAKADQFLIHNGSQWVAEDFHIDTELTYQGGISVVSDPAPSANNGDLYINNEAGTVGASWTGIAGKAITPAVAVGWSAKNARWYMLGDIASAAVMRVEAGLGIDVDDTKPAEPVVSIDRTETDKWYAPLWEQNGNDIYYNDGNVGVGTDNPASPLHVKVATNENVRFSGGGGDTRITALNDNASATTQLSIQGDPLLFRTAGGAEHMRIDATGAVNVKSGVLKIDGDNSSNYTNSRILMESGGAVRGAGSFILNTANSTEWFYGNPYDTPDSFVINRVTGSTHQESAAVTDHALFIVDSAGKVGIGGQPSRSTKEIEDDAVATLATWDSKDKKPTKAELIKSLAERNIGGGTAKLQVDGAAFTTGDITAFRFNTTGGVFNTATTAGYFQVGGVNQMQYDTAQLYPSTDGGQSLGTNSFRWGNGYFSGTIYGTVDDVPSHVKNITPTQIANWDAGTGGGGGGATTDGRISDTQITNWDHAYDWGNHATAGYQTAGNYADANHNHSGVYQPAGNYALVGASYTKAESDAKYELKGEGGGGGLPDGDWICEGSIYAKGNVTAYYSSDERLKDDITAMPIGLIDSIKPVTWKWKENGKDSGGVVAQQLQECGLEDWVNEAPNGDLGVDYNALIGLLLAEVKDLKLRVKELEG